MSRPVYEAPDQSGRVVLVTGANSGLGFAIARAFALKGAHLLLACRDAARARVAADALRSETVAPVDVVRLDLADLASVQLCAAEVLAGQNRLDLLINNAGVMAVDAARTTDGFEMHLGVNHLGHFALTARLAPLVLATPGSRIVTMSSVVHRVARLRLDDLFFERGYDRWGAYSQSKLANLLFTFELHRRLSAVATTTMALAAHPGGTRTELGSEGHSVTNLLTRTIVMRTFQAAAGGALPLLRAATDPAAAGGQYYGPRFIARGAPVLEVPAARARSPLAALALWERSEELTGCTFEIVGLPGGEPGC